MFHAVMKLISSRPLVHPVQVPRCPSKIVPGIKTKFKEFSGEIKKI